MHRKWKRIMITILKLIVLQFWLVYRVKCEQEFEIEPTDVTVHRGSPVNLPCKVKNLKGTLQWTMDGFGLGTDRQLKSYTRFMMIGSNETGNYTLHITAALLADEAEYQCQVGGTDEEKPLRSAIAKLTVLYPPKDDIDQVYINPESPLQTIAGATVRITCRGGLTKPVSKITWKRGNATIEDGVSETVEALPNSMLESVTSWVDLKPDKSYHKENISCVVQHDALEQPIVRHLIMYVQYAPEVSIAKHFIKAREGSDIKFTCSATGNPPDLRFRWEVNDVAVIGDHETEFTFKDLTRGDNKAKVACIVSNAVGKGRAEEVISVEYQPKFTNRPTDVDAEEGKEVVLKCLVDSNPPAEIVWTHENSQKVLGHGAEWKIKVDQITKGIYLCRAAAPGFSEISRAIEVLVRGPPKIEPDQVSFGIEGTTAKIQCIIKSIPPPSEVSWSKNGIRIKPVTSGQYDIRQVNTSRGVISSLWIQETTASSFGGYNCTASNKYGSRTATILFTRKQTLPLVTTLVAIIGGLFFLFIVIVLIVIFKRHRFLYKDKNLEKQTTSSTDDSAFKSDGRTLTVSEVTPSEGEGEEDDWDVSDTTSATRCLQRPRYGDTYRFSGDYSDSGFPPKSSNNNGTGYIPYVDYNKDYNPPLPPPPISYNRNTLYTAVPLNNVDPRFSAAYGNPYLKVPQSNVSKGSQNIYGAVASPKVTANASYQPPSVNMSNNNLNNVGPNDKNFLRQNLNVLGQNKINIDEQYASSKTGKTSQQHRNMQGTPI